VLGAAISAPAAPVFTGGNGIVVFGVAPYGGAPNVDGPTYLANNFTGRNDILTSPGLGSLGGYLTANPVVANNIFSLGPLGLPVGGFQVGGVVNGVGAFGAGAILNTGPLIGYALADSGPGGGTASYGITSEIATWTNVGAAVPVGTKFGDWITMAGAVPLVGNADVVGLEVHLTDTMGAFPGGFDLAHLVLAISRNGLGNTAANYNIVTLGGGVGIIIDNGNTGAFRAAAVNNVALANAIPVGDVITVTATFTGYADPAMFTTFDLTTQPDLLAMTGPLPGISFVNTTGIPEPASIVLASVGLLGVLGCAVRRWRK
jgi:hypothetical protein